MSFIQVYLNFNSSSFQIHSNLIGISDLSACMQPSQSSLGRLNEYRENSQLGMHGFGSLHNLTWPCYQNEASWFDADFVSPIKLTTFRLIHSFVYFASPLPLITTYNCLVDDISSSLIENKDPPTLPFLSLISVFFLI